MDGIWEMLFFPHISGKVLSLVSGRVQARILAITAEHPNTADGAHTTKSPCTRDVYWPLNKEKVLYRIEGQKPFLKAKCLT